MAEYINITSTTAIIVDVNPNNTGQQYAGNISSISICNNSLSNAVISVKLEDHDTNTMYYMVKDIVVPSGITLLLDHDVSFDVSKFKLHLDNSGSNKDITAIIK